MARNVVWFDDGDVAAIVYDEETQYLEIYDEVPDEPEDALERATYDTVLVQAKMNFEHVDKLITALGGQPK